MPGAAAPPAHCLTNVRLEKRRAGQLLGAVSSPEQQPFSVFHHAGLLEVGREIGLKVTEAGHGVRLAPSPSAAPKCGSPE
jgi:hypothetical protein